MSIADRYGFVDRYGSERVPLPAWGQLWAFREGLHRVGALFLEVEEAAYRTEGREVYVRFTLDVGDRPVDLRLYRDGELELDTPLWPHLPVRACHFVLSELAPQQTRFAYRLEPPDVLIAHLEAGFGGDPADLVDVVSFFIEETGRAIEDLVCFLYPGGSGLA